MATPNILNVSTINGNTAVANVTTVATAAVSNPAASNKITKINGLYITNANVNTQYVTVDLFRTSVTYGVRIAANVAIPTNASIDVLSKSIYLLEGDSLRTYGSANASMELVCSYEDIS